MQHTFEGNRVTRDTGCEFPVFQAPIGLISRAELVGAVSAAGGVGLLETSSQPIPDLKAEFTAVPFLRGSFAAARAGSPDSANSQFFIMFAPRPELDNNYTIMGRVVAGMDAVDAIVPGEPPEQPTKIVRAYLGDARPASAAGN